MARKATAIYVSERRKREGKSLKLHLPDCWHFDGPDPEMRRATAKERRELAVCRNCQD